MTALIHGVLGGALSREPLEVEVLEDDQAEVMALGSRRTFTVPRASLPLGAREGDIIVSGHVDLIATGAMRERIREQQAEARPIPAGFSLEDPGEQLQTQPLTPRPVR